MKKYNILLVLFFLFLGRLVQAEEPSLATSFIYPVLGPNVTDPTQNTQDPRVTYNDPQCTAASGLWYTNANDFGEDYIAPQVCPIDSCGVPCYHPGEDWNLCPTGSDESGTTIYSVANGKVVRVSTVLASGSGYGYYLTIEHKLPQLENIADYDHAETTATGTFDTVYSSYLHINNPTLQEGDIVKKGDPIGTIFYLAGAVHLHFELKTSGIGSANCPCGYCSSAQNITDSYYLEPDKFIKAHLSDLTVSPIGSIGTGEVMIKGQAGSFGNSSGSVTMRACMPSCQDLVPTVLSWKDAEIKLDLFVSGFNMDKFNRPIRLTIKRQDGTQVGQVLYPFRDVSQEVWFAELVTRLWKDGVVTGKGGQGIFAPNDQTTRAEFIKMAVVASGEECKWYLPDCWNSPNYTDIHSDDWFYKYVQAAYNKGWLDTTKTEFYPNNPIQRAEVIKILVTALGEEDASYSTDSLFTDVTNPAAWFYPFVYIGKKLQIIEGYPDGTFGPDKNINRAEVAKVIVQAFLK